MTSAMVLMQVAMVALLATFSFLLLRYFRKFADRRPGYWPILIVSSLVNVLVMVIGRNYLLPTGTTSLILFVFVTIEYVLLYHTNFDELVFASGLFVFCLVVWRGIFVGIFAFVFGVPPQQVIDVDTYYYPMFTGAILFAILVSVAFAKWFMPENRMRQLFRNRSQLGLVARTQVLLIAYLLFMNSGRVFMNSTWFTYMYLGTFVLVYVAIVYIYYSALSTSAFIEDEVHSRMLEQQLKRQVRHYEEYKEFTESYRKFRHDFNGVIGTVKTLIRSGESEQAVLLLDEIGDTMQGQVKMHKTYSDNVLVDALLQDVAKACKVEGIEFSAAVHVPLRKSSLSDLDVVRLGSNILYNAFEACLRIPPGERRFISIAGNTTADWVHIEVANSFTGDVRYEGNELASLKEAPGFHGMGLKIAREIIEKLGGFLVITPDTEKRVFTVQLNVPITGR